LYSSRWYVTNKVLCHVWFSGYSHSLLVNNGHCAGHYDFQHGRHLVLCFIFVPRRIFVGTLIHENPNLEPKFTAISQSVATCFSISGFRGIKIIQPKLLLFKGQNGREQLHFRILNEAKIRECVPRTTPTLHFKE
jgi:hypothetical protein